MIATIFKLPIAFTVIIEETIISFFIILFLTCEKIMIMKGFNCEALISSID